MTPAWSRQPPQGCIARRLGLACRSAGTMFGARPAISSAEATSAPCPRGFSAVRAQAAGPPRGSDRGPGGGCVSVSPRPRLHPFPSTAAQSSSRIPPGGTWSAGPWGPWVSAVEEFLALGWGVQNSGPVGFLARQRPGKPLGGAQRTGTEPLLHPNPARPAVQAPLSE